MHNWIDLTLAVLMIVSIVSGVKLGLVRTSIGLLASIVALVLSGHSAARGCRRSIGS